VTGGISGCVLRALRVCLIVQLCLNVWWVANIITFSVCLFVYFALSRH